MNDMINLRDINLKQSHRELLYLGLQFVPTEPINPNNLKADIKIDRFMRQIKLNLFFGNEHREF